MRIRKMKDSTFRQHLDNHKSLSNKNNVSKHKIKMRLNSGRPYLIWAGGGMSLASTCPSRPIYLPYIVLIILLSTLYTVNCQVKTCNVASACYPPFENFLQTIDSLPGRTLNVSSTCGVPLTTFYQKPVDSQDATVLMCNASEHNPSDMYDTRTVIEASITLVQPVWTTYWQSQNTVSTPNAKPNEEYIIVSLNDSFLITRVRITFVAALIPTTTSILYDTRPDAMVIEKQVAENGPWIPLRYYAEKCQTEFPTVIYQSNIVSFNATAVVCRQKYFGGDMTSHTGYKYVQEVLFEPSVEFRNEFYKSYNIMKTFEARAIRLRFVRPAELTPRRSYYTIADLTIDGQCSCFGHATQCNGPNKAACVCGHNTMGSNCEQCKPLFNNKAWNPGYAGSPNVCEDCQCNGHASSCHYDSVKKYGVCDNCIKQTTGDKCQFCSTFYYVNPQKNASLTGQCSGLAGTTNVTYDCGDWCIPCNCDQQGTVASTGYTCQNATGQCECKINVEGRACDTCKDLFWNLMSANVQGCQSCDCYLPGTFNSSNLCDKKNGTCVCKSNVIGRKCDSCRPGTYDLRISNAEGCFPCDCVPGASMSSICPASYPGQCPCRNRLAGRRCDRASDGFFVPALDQMTFEAEVANGLDTLGALNTTVTLIPGHGEPNAQYTGRGVVKLQPLQKLSWMVSTSFTGLFKVIARFQSLEKVYGMEVTFTRRAGPLTSYSCGSTVVNPAVPIKLQKTFEGTKFSIPTRGIIDYGEACLQAGTSYNMTYYMSSNLEAGITNFYLDSVVLMPVISNLAVFKEANTTEQAAMQQCFDTVQKLNDTLRAQQSCPKYEYMLMAEAYSGASLCTCNNIGTKVSTVCSPQGGQCVCNPGVIMKDCSLCQVYHYNFASGQGCTACNCNVNGSQDLQCDEKGVCRCKDNVVPNSKCDKCLPEFFGLFTGNGCTKCQCNMDYSTSNNCADSGQCPCKPGVGGLDCNQCLDGYFNLTLSGCTSCGCNPDGTLGNTCDKQNGKCTCKANAIGAKCDQCPLGSFGLGPYGNNGCLPCLCSGQSQNCTSATGWYRDQISSTWSLQDTTALELPWTGVDSTGNVVPVERPTNLNGLKAQFVMRLVNTPANLGDSVLYYQASKKFLGDKRTAYGQYFTFSITNNIPQPTCPQLVNVTSNSTTNGTSTQQVLTQVPCNDTQMLTSLLGDVILQGAATSYSLVTALPTTPTDVRTEYKFRLHETVWKVSNVNGPSPSYRQVIETLASLGSIKIRAKFSNVTGSYVDLYTATLDYSVPTNTSFGPVNNVEMCTCPTGYVGQFCEQCAPGYTRSRPNGGPFSPCVLCKCNNHSLTTVKCHPETGACNCSHNTAGRECERCADGYHGNALAGTPSDCSPCMCPGNVVAGAVNAFAKTCTRNAATGAITCNNCSLGYTGAQCQQCTQNWYGTPQNVTNNFGKCTACNCRGRADTCNPTTGICINCRNNTAGKECDICAPTFFGNADLLTCKSCGCTSPGSTGQCNPQTGQCVCKPNVQGFKCDQCMPNTFNYNSGLGCTLCDCHPQGAFSPTCNITTGQCTCRPHATGRQCDSCETGFWNLNTLTGCNACNCTPAGTFEVNGKMDTSCNLTTGQCRCKTTAIIGRTCNICARGTLGTYKYVHGVDIGSYPACQLCGECYDNWATRIDEVGIAIDQQYATAINIWSHYDNRSSSIVRPTLDMMEKNITDAKDSISTAIEMTRKLNYLTTGFSKVLTDTNSLNQTLLSLEEEQAVIRGNLTRNQQFTGVIQVDAQTMKTTGQVLTEAQNAQTSAQQYLQSGRNDFQNISSLTEVIKNSNTTALQGVEKVNTAMRALAVAEQNRQTAESIVNNTFNTEFAKNSEEIAKIITVTDTFGPRDTAIKARVTTTNGLLVNANETLRSAQVTIGLQRTQMDAKVAQATVTKFNASEAQRASQNAQSAARTFKNIALQAKSDMTKVIENLAKDLQTIKNIQTRLEVVNKQVEEINNAKLRTLAEMQAITTKITSTTISPTKVAQISANAAAAKQQADQALTVTRAAIDQATLAQNTVQRIRDDLNSAQAKRTQTAASIQTLVNQNKTISEVLDEVNAKSAKATAAADSTTANVNSLLAYITNIQSCFSARLLEAQNALASVQNNNAVVSVTRKSQETNTANLNTVTGTIATKMSQITDQQKQLDETKTNMAALTASLTAASQVANLKSLLDEFSAQNREMVQMQAEMVTMETELDGIINLLQNGAGTVSCRNP